MIQLDQTASAPSYSTAGLRQSDSPGILDGLGHTDVEEIRRLAIACSSKDGCNRQLVSHAVDSIRLLNASPLRSSCSVERTDGAYAMLGDEWICRIALAHKLAGQCLHMADEANRHDEAFVSWHQAITLAFSGELLARVAGKATSADAWTCGLLAGLSQTVAIIEGTSLPEIEVAGTIAQIDRNRVAALLKTLNVNSRLAPPRRIGMAAQCPWTVVREASNVWRAIKTSQPRKLDILQWPTAVLRQVEKQFVALDAECRAFAWASWNTV